MLGGLSWIINFKCWNVKLKVGCYNLMLAAQVECWGLKLIFGSLSWIINFECWNVELKVECYNLMLVGQVKCWGLKLIFGVDWTPYILERCYRLYHVYNVGIERLFYQKNHKADANTR